MVDAELAANHVNELDGGCTRATREEPTVGIDHIHAGHDGGQYRCQTEARGTVGMEIDGNRDVLLQELNERSDTAGRNQTRHILDGDHIGTQGCHLLGLVEEVGIRKDGLRLLLAQQTLQERGLGVLRIDRVADGAVGNTAILLYVLDGRFYIIYIVQGVEDTHNTQTALDGVAAETVDDFIRIGGIAEEVATTRQGRQLRYVAHHLVDALQTGPGVLAQVAHHRVGHGTAPYLHCKESGLFVVGQTAIDLLLIHSRGERRLLAVTQREISDFEYSCHNLFYF